MSNDGGNTLWTWQVQETDGRWSTVGVLLEGNRHMPLVGRSERAVRAAEHLAIGHARATNQRLRFATFELTSADEVEV